MICNMKSLLPLLIILPAALSHLKFSTLDARDQTPCCGNHSISLAKNHSRECENGQKPQLSCQHGLTKVTHAFHVVFYGEDDKGKFMSGYTYENSFLIRAPDYCTANQTVDGRSSVTALYCTDEIQSKSSKRRDFLRDFMLLFVAISFLLSSFMLARIAVYYSILPETQQIEDKCTFHMTLNLSLFCLLASLAAFLESITKTDQQPREHCGTYWYLLMFTAISFFTWCAVQSAHILSVLERPNVRIHKVRTMSHYQLIGYGFPALVVVLSNMYIFSRSFAKTLNPCLYCDLDSPSGYFLIHAFLPIIFIQVICLCSIVGLHEQFQKNRSGNSPEDLTSNVQKYPPGLRTNAKLLLLTVPPSWLLMLWFALYVTEYELLAESDTFVKMLLGILCFISAEGLIIYYLLVTRRKRIVQAIAKRYRSRANTTSNQDPLNAPTTVS